MTRYCPDCGTPHECVTEQRDVDKTAVEIERLRTHRDIEVARLTAGAEKHIADVEAEHSAEHAEGVAEGMETALDAVAGGAPEITEGEPIVVETEPEPEAEVIEEPDSAPEVVEVSTPPAPKRGGYWDLYS